MFFLNWSGERERGDGRGWIMETSAFAESLVRTFVVRSSLISVGILSCDSCECPGALCIALD